jgi:predicted RNase H-like HicB family nuclease
MTRTYSLLIEGDQSGYSAHVPELPTVLVTGNSLDELTERAGEAIRLYLEAAQSEVSSTAFRKEIEVELPV